MYSRQKINAFGSPKNLRQFNLSSARTGFNGKEKDDEVSGGGNSYDYGFRIYNPRLARFLSVDPLIQSYPWYTPYQFAGNTPIWAIDLDGLEEWKLSKENVSIKTFYGPFSPEYIDGKAKKIDLVQNAKSDAKCIIESINKGDIKIDAPYPMLFDASGLDNVPIEYAVGNEFTGGEVKENKIFIYDVATQYPSKTTSVMLHEFLAHYIENINDLICCETKGVSVITEDPNPFYGTKDDPFKTKTIQVLGIGEAPDQLKEEINGHSLQLQLDKNGSLPLSDVDRQNKETVLKGYIGELKKVYEVQSEQNKQSEEEKK